MNMYDTEVAGGLLKGRGMQILPSEWESTEPVMGDKNSPFPEADVVLMNTCSVREHAEEKVFGRLGILGKIKKKKPDLIVGLMGCMVEEHREKLFKRFPQLDLMVGTRNIKELPDLVEEVRRTRQQAARIKQDGISIEYTDQIQRHGKYHAWLPIMTGCNKVCTFCIVPITRGAEVSMPAREVYREVSRLVGEGVTRITLLGQNVNSYNGAGHFEAEGREISGISPGFARRNDINFPELLDMLCQIEGLENISFTTSHPSDATEGLYRVIAKNPKISRRFHLPLQSGSDRMLKRMKRLHSYAEYKTKIDLMRQIIPDIAISTDIIAGFSGETDEDHAATARALEEIRYDSAYIYKYSVRGQTPASKLADDVPITIKEKRNAELLEIQKRITRQINEQLIGQTFEVFVAETSVKDSSRLVGHTSAEKKIIFPGEKTLLGTKQKVKVESLRRETLIGALAGC
ncbi:MAG: tRNA (N6-isopentenyl adenosine(37)-C2)-methylthiotransferase MiaB [Candidatus Omnitrophica bacterium]|nr:tRNA (N6-isopentenyl adenosine(37)-C2)-methylthiotransferase MiaB [Candidatus Omnitrophota bacterium]